MGPAQLNEGPILAVVAQQELPVAELDDTVLAGCIIAVYPQTIGIDAGCNRRALAEHQRQHQPQGREQAVGWKGERAEVKKAGVHRRDYKKTDPLGRAQMRW